MIRNKVFRNASWIIACKIIQALMSLVVSMLTARFLGPSNFGVINYAASVVAFAVPIMQLGINSVIVQDLVSNPDEEGKIMGTSAILCFISSLASIAGVVAFVALANRGERETIIVCALYSLLLIFQALEIMQYWFQAKYLSKYTSIIMLIVYAIVTVYKIYLLATEKSVYWFAVSQSIEYALVAVGLFIGYKKLGSHRLSFSLAVAKRLWNKGKYYIVSTMMVTVFAQTDKIMIKMMIDDASVGYYSAAVFCASMLGFVFVAIMDSFRPLILENKNVSEEKYESSLKTLYSITLYFALVQSIGLTVFAKLAIHILYGEAYYEAISALQIIVWYTTFSYMGAVRNIWILAEGKQRYLWIINLSGALLNVVLNYFMIPVWGINGAAIASLITQFFTNFVISYIIWPIHDNNRLVIQSLNPMILINGIKKLLKEEKADKA